MIAVVSIFKLWKLPLGLEILIYPPLSTNNEMPRNPLGSETRTVLGIGAHNTFVCFGILDKISIFYVSGLRPWGITYDIRRQLGVRKPFESTIFSWFIL